MRKSNVSKSKPYIKYFFLFVFFLLCLMFFFTVNKGDTYVNYGFSYAISRGQIPYKDFNMVITPFAPFLYSIGLIFSKSIFVFYLEQAMLLTILFYFLFKLLGEKAWLFLLGMVIPFPIAMSTTFFPGYNFLVFLLFVLLIYFIENKKSDFLIGILLGIIFCTKQTIGISLFIPSLYYLFKDRKKFFSRVLGYLIPVGIMFLYLLFTGSFYNFIDLCFLGLFDFGSSNGNINYFYLIILIIGVSYLIYRCIKEKNNYLNYYVLCFSIITLPIIDYYHVSLFLLGILFVILDSFDLKYRNISRYVLLIIFVIIGLWGLISRDFFVKPVVVSYNNFPLTVVSNKYDKQVSELLGYVNTSEYEVVYLLRGSENYFYKIINNKDLNYFDLPNYGNYGYNGVNRMIAEVKKLNNVIVIIDRELMDNSDSGQQYVKELGKEVIRSSKKIKSIGIYDIYLKS